MHDVLYACRMLRKSPAFTLVVVAILALGIGVNTAVFSVVNSVLLRPLPYADADRLVAIWETNARLGVEREGPSGPNYLDWKEQNQSFEELALLEIGTGTLTGLGEPEQFPGLRVSTNYLSMIGIRPQLGRIFTAADGAGSGRHNVAVLSHGFWMRRFGGNPGVIGMKLTVNHQVYECVGVLPANAWSPLRADAYVPWPDDELRSRSRSNRDFGVIGRLKRGVTVERAQQDMDAISARLAKQYPFQEGWKSVLVPLQEAIVEYIRPALLLLLASVAFVLLLACANVANLLLARATGRQREVSIRTALGARRGRIVRQFLAENLVLSLLGGTVGVLLAIWGVDLLTRALPASIPLPNASAEVMLPAVAVDARALLFAIAISLGSSILFGLAPAIQASRADLNRVLKEGGRGSTGAGSQHRVRRLLVISETALAFMLLMGAALTARSFFELQRVNPGVRTANVTTFRLTLPTDSLYQTRAQQAEFFRQALENVRNIPGVLASGITSVIPLGQENDRVRFRLPESGQGVGSELMADHRRVSPQFFEAMGIPLLRGRVFSDHDAANRPAVAIIDEPFARQFFPHDNPVGRHLDLDGTVEIVGVVGAVHHRGLDHPARPAVYLSYLQSPKSRMGLVVRTSADPDAIVPAVKQAIWKVDKDQPVFMIRSMEEYVSMANSAPRIALMLLGVFATVALGLAAFGIYGVVSYTVSQRTHEFGLRMALGAEPSMVQNLVMRTGLKWTAGGLVAGLAGTLLLAPALRSVLYGVSALDPLVIAASSVILLLIAAAANYFPARSATRVDPMEALRYE